MKEIQWIETKEHTVKMDSNSERMDDIITKINITEKNSE